jgi:excisionase family DNA binding protein
MPEYMTVAEARDHLKVSRGKMTRLIKDGTLETIPDPLDARVKLVKKADVEKLKLR